MSPAPSRESSVINETEGAEGSPQAQKEGWEETWGSAVPRSSASQHVTAVSFKGQREPLALRLPARCPHSPLQQAAPLCPHFSTGVAQ